MQKKKKVAAFLIACLIVVSACAEESAPASEKKSPSESGAHAGLASFGADGSFDPVSDILDKTESNVWTIEQGIILHLKLHVGEISSQAYSGIDENFEIGDLLGLAYSYLRTGDNEDAKREIERLLQIVDPSIEDLLRSSKPAEPRASRSNRLGELVLGGLNVLVPAVQAQTATCDDVWAGTAAASAGPAGLCWSVEEWKHLGRTHRIFFPSPWDSGTDPRTGLIDVIKEGFNKALSKYRNNLGVEIRSINALILTADNARNNNVLASASPEGGQFNGTADCRIKVYRAAYDPFDDDTFMRSGDSLDTNIKQVLAHEVFHCIQTWNLTRQMYGPFTSSAQKFGVFARSRKWWSEGTAEYFGNTVYACNQLEWKRIGSFNARSLNTSIVDLRYENAVTFQYLANQVSDTGVFDVLRAMPVSGQRVDQLQAIGETTLGDRFHEFGRAYVDEDIADSCRDTQLPINSSAPEVVIERGMTWVDEAEPYQLSRRKLVFDAASLKISYDSPDADVDDAYREVEPAWTPPPTDVEGACSAKEGMLLYTFKDTTSRVEYVIEELNEPEPRSVIDSCLVGSWRASSDSINEIAQWIAANPLTRNTAKTGVVSAAGSLQGRIDRNGRASGRMSDLEQVYLTDINFGDQTLTNKTTVIINGQSAGKYSAQNGILTVWNVCTDSATRAKVELDGQVISDMEVDMQKFADMGSVYGLKLDKVTGEALIDKVELPTTWSFPYRCSGSTLEVDPPAQDTVSVRKTAAESRPPWRFRKQ